MSESRRAAIQKVMRTQGLSYAQAVAWVDKALRAIQQRIDSVKATKRTLVN
jgi:uncharacterized protein YoaH (UPF0181 family)